MQTAVYELGQDQAAKLLGLSKLADGWKPSLALRGKQMAQDAYGVVTGKNVERAQAQAKHLGKPEQLARGGVSGTRGRQLKQVMIDIPREKRKRDRAQAGVMAGGLVAGTMLLKKFLRSR